MKGVAGRQWPKTPERSTMTAVETEERRMTEVEHLSVAERVALGKAARASTPRSNHAQFDPASDRPDPIALLERQAESRVPELVPIRYGRMGVSPFTFYRGAALLQAADLAHTPSAGLQVQLCGDAHLSNFGVFASPERRLVFDINDFDETLPGPFEWDVKRLAASLSVAGRENGYPEAQRKTIVRDAVGAYRETMRELAGKTNLEVWYSHLDVEDLMATMRQLAPKAMLKRTEKALDKAKTKDSMQVFKKLTRVVDGEPRIVGDPPLIEPIDQIFKGFHRDQIFEEMQKVLRSYRSTLQYDRRVLLEEFRLVDVARKVVGVGSVGTRAWIGLLLGRDGDDPLFLQLKEAQPSVLEEFTQRSTVKSNGERVVNGQHLMQAASDIFLGWAPVTGIDGVHRDFYGRQLKDWKGSAEIELMVPQGMQLYARMCGWTLARAHARSGDRIAIGAYMGSGDSFDRAIADFAETYADQNERDYKALTDAVASGRIEAKAGL
jgi:uncharacterized protein (DUF2252 family)